MHPSRMAVPLLFATLLLACQAEGGGVSTISPSSGAAEARAPIDFFFLNDFERDYSATVGLVSDVADLNQDPDCGGSGPRIIDGGIEQAVFTPTGAVRITDRWQKATLVLYDGATDDVCDVAGHPVVARGEVNFRFSARDADPADPAIHFQVHMTGLVDLTEGGKAHVLLTANFFLDEAGTPHVRTDRFELTPVGN